VEKRAKLFSSKKHKTLSEMQNLFEFNFLKISNCFRSLWKILDCFKNVQKYFELLESIWKVFGLFKQHFEGSGML